MNGVAAIHRTSSMDTPARRSRLSINGPLGISLIALIVAASVIAAGLATLLTTVFALSLGEDDPQVVLGQLEEEHERKIAEDKERFNGRSVFFKPPAPPVKRDPVPQPTIVEPPPVIPSGPPQTYTGPSIIYALSDAVCFKGVGQNEKQFTVRVGEEKNDVKVIALSLPWNARLGHKGGEYDVQIFKPFDETKYLPAQARPMTVVQGIIEVPPPEMKAPVIQAPDEQQVIEAAAAAENLERARAVRRPGRPVPGAAGGANPPDREVRRAQREETGEGVEDDDVEPIDEAVDDDDAIAEDEDEPIEDEEPLEDEDDEVEETGDDEDAEPATPSPQPQEMSGDDAR